SEKTRRSVKAYAANNGLTMAQAVEAMVEAARAQEPGAHEQPEVLTMEEARELASKVIWTLPDSREHAVDRAANLIYFLLRHGRADNESVMKELAHSVRSLDVVFRSASDGPEGDEETQRRLRGFITLGH